MEEENSSYLALCAENDRINDEWSEQVETFTGIIGDLEAQIKDLEKQKKYAEKCCQENFGCMMELKKEIDGYLKSIGGQNRQINLLSSKNKEAYEGWKREKELRVKDNHLWSEWARKVLLMPDITSSAIDSMMKIGLLVDNEGKGGSCIPLVNQEVESEDED